MTDYKKIKIEETGIITASKNLDAVYATLKENNINTLEELFERDNEDSIVYTSKSYNLSLSQTKGTIKLLRYKYLEEDLSVLNILDGEIICRGVPRLKRSNDEKALPVNIATYICMLGLSYNFALELQKNMTQGEKIIDILKKVYYGEIKLTNNIENARNIDKIIILIEWYNLKHNIKSETVTLESVREELKELYSKLKMLKEHKKEIDLEIDFVNKKIERAQVIELQILRKKL